MQTNDFFMLSPMAGFTDAPMRLICSRFGAARTFTEMVNAAGLARDGDASWALLETLPGEPKPFAHLYGSNPDEFAAAAEKVAATGCFSGIDINAGCPAPKVVREGAGSALMRNPRLVGRIVSTAKAASGLPVSVKTRIGYTPSDITVFGSQDGRPVWMVSLWHPLSTRALRSISMNRRLPTHCRPKRYRSI